MRLRRWSSLSKPRWSSPKRWSSLSRPLLSRPFLFALLVGYCLFLAWVVLWPSPAPATETVAHTATVLKHVGAPPQVTTGDRVEFGLNALMVVPVPLLATLLWPRRTWQWWTAWGFVASCAVEACQAIFLHHRAPQMTDIVSNTLGAFVGGVLGTAVRRKFAGRFLRS